MAIARPMMQERLADTGAVVSVVSALSLGIGHATEVATLAAAIIAALSGLAALTWHVLKIWDRFNGRD